MKSSVAHLLRLAAPIFCQLRAKEQPWGLDMKSSLLLEYDSEEKGCHKHLHLYCRHTQKTASCSLAREAESCEPDLYVVGVSCTENSRFTSSQDLQNKI